MIDIHCHLLPGVDDGAKSLEEALGIAQQLYKSGFRKAIATPHVFEGRDYLKQEIILESVHQLNEYLAGHNIELEILPGAENYIFPDMAKWASEGRLLTLGNQGRYLLIELPRLDIPHYTDKVFFELQVEGITPILAHPERYKKLKENPQRLLEWARRGILLQINLRSLTGHYGPEVQTFAHWMVENRLASFIGSDAHRPTKNTDSYLLELKTIEGSTNYEYLESITKHNPTKIFDNTTIKLNLKEEYQLLNNMHSSTQQLKAHNFFTQKLKSLFGK